MLHRKQETVCVFAARLLTASALGLLSDFFGILNLLVESFPVGIKYGMRLVLRNCALTDPGSRSLYSKFCSGGIGSSRRSPG